MTQLEQLTAIISQARRDMRGAYASAGDIDRAIAERLVEKGAILPRYKLGDTVYLIEDGKILDLQVESAHYGAVVGGGVDAYYELIDSESGDGYWYIYDEDLGKTVFLTREAAEKALAERSNR